MFRLLQRDVYGTFHNLIRGPTYNAIARIQKDTECQHEAQTCILVCLFVFASQIDLGGIEALLVLGIVSR